VVSLLRFADLKARGIVNNRIQLRRLQELHGFPRGRMLSPNARTWTEQEIKEWYSSRPVDEPSALRGAAREKHERKAAAKPATDLKNQAVVVEKARPPP
jgi:hypothetical protein